MGDALLWLLVVNSLLFSFIFWVLTFCCKLFYQDKYSNFKLNFYECGFKGISGIRVNVPVHIVLISLFLIIYDSEFLVLYGAAFNLFYVSSTQLLLMFVFISFLAAALVVDYFYSALDWSL